MDEAAEGETGVPGGRQTGRTASMRRWMISAWMEDTLWVVVLFAPGLFLLPMVLGEPPGDPGDAALARWLLLIWAVALLFVAVWRLHVLPQHLTGQYLQAGEHGLLLVQERMWWFPGRALVLPWSDITSVAREERSINDTPRRLLAVYLTDAGAGRLARVPTFSYYRGRGVGWHGTAPLPRLIVYPRRRGDTVREIARQVREIRPEIVDAPHGR